MKKTFASHSFAVLTAAFMMVGAAGCASVPAAPDQAAAEVPPTVDAVSATSAADPVAGSAPTVEDSTPSLELPATPAAPSSLGASSSGRGH